MHKFYAAGGHKSESASRIIKARFEVNQKYDIPVKDIEHFDLSISFGLLANAAPTSFWLVYYLYSDPMLLTEVRANIHESLVFDNVQSESSGKKIVLVNIPDVIARCPLLASFVSEVLRVQSVNASARVIREDTILDNKYLLKKNSFIFIPSASLHKNEKAWGPTASAFNPHRFNTQKKLGVTRENRIPVSAHRSWGGGVNLCPGRFFAMNELLSILIIMALKYDVHPISGVWQEPPRKVHVMASIMEPARDLPVRIKKRENVEALEFKFVWQSQNDIRDS